MRTGTRSVLISSVCLWGGLISCGGSQHPRVAAESLRKNTIAQPHVDLAAKQFQIDQSITDSYTGVAELQQFLQTYQAQISQAKDTIALMGGFNSCRPRLISKAFFKKAAVKLQQLADRGQFFRFVVSCFKKTRPTAYYFSSADPEVLKSVPTGEVTEVVYAEAQESPLRNLYVVGHSWGGWLALRTVLTMPEPVNVLGLASIDPISQPNCHIAPIVTSYMRSYWDVNPHLGCIQSPQDITVAMRREIADKSGWWHNFYQYNSGFLHSGPMDFAENHYINYDFAQFWTIFDGHRLMDMDERVWEQFFDAIVAS